MTPLQQFSPFAQVSPTAARSLPSSSVSLPGVPSPQRVVRTVVKWLVAPLCLSVLVMAVILWYRPFAIIDRATQLKLMLTGMHSRDVIIDGHKIHYLVGGSGAPILLVHGLGSRATDWAGLIPPLVRSGRKVYAIDLLGYGTSDRPGNAQYSIQDEAGIVEGFLDAEHLQHVDLAGWSMGGWISMVVATDMPARISRLILMDSAGLRFKPGFDTVLFTPTDLSQLRELEHLLVPDAPVMPAFMGRAFLDRARPDAWVIRRSVEAMMTGQNLLDNRLAGLKMPVLIMWGKQDMLTPVNMAYQLHAGVPQSQLEVFDGCGHLAPGLCSKQMAPRLVSFLDGQPDSQKDATLEIPGGAVALSSLW